MFDYLYWELMHIVGRVKAGKSAYILESKLIVREVVIVRCSDKVVDPIIGHGFEIGEENL